MWHFVLLIFLCQLLQKATLNLCCLSLKNNKSLPKMSTKIDTRRGEKLENMKNEKEGKSTNTDEEDITSTTTAVTIRFTSFFLADLLCMKWFDF
jgi:hypothetical protein